MSAVAQKPAQMRNFQVVPVGLENVIGPHPVYGNEEQGGFCVRAKTGRSGGGRKEKDYRKSAHDFDIVYCSMLVLWTRIPIPV
jgi:hypothetical protein